MEFIGLSTAVARIADCVQLDPHLDDRATAIGDISRAAADKFWKENNPKTEWARSFGVAACILNKALHDSNMPPQWMEFDKQKRFAVKNDTVKQEGIELLTHATGWGNREQSNCSRHFFNALFQGDDALAMPIARGLNDGLAPDGKMLRFLNIGFDRAELVAFLDKNQIEHNLKPSPVPAPSVTPVVAMSSSGGDSFSQILAMAGMAVLSMKVAQAEATNHLENSPAAIKLLNRLAELEAKKNQAPAPQAITPSPAPEPQTLPLVAASAPGGMESATGKKWTPEKLAELKSYREKHGTKKAAEHFGISEQRIRGLLPSEKPQPKGYSAFTHRPK